MHGWLFPSQASGFLSSSTPICVCLFWRAGILTHHVGYTLQFEQTLQLVNPVVSVPYWEYTIEGLLSFYSTRTVCIITTARFLTVVVFLHVPSRPKLPHSRFPGGDAATLAAGGMTATSLDSLQA